MYHCINMFVTNFRYITFHQIMHSTYPETLLQVPQWYWKSSSNGRTISLAIIPKYDILKLQSLQKLFLPTQTYTLPEFCVFYGRFIHRLCLKNHGIYLSRVRNGCPFSLSNDFIYSPSNWKEIHRIGSWIWLMLISQFPTSQISKY